MEKTETWWRVSWNFRSVEPVEVARFTDSSVWVVVDFCGMKRTNRRKREDRYYRTKQEAVEFARSKLAENVKWAHNDYQRTQQYLINFTDTYMCEEQGQ